MKAETRLKRDAYKTIEALIKIINQRIAQDPDDLLRSWPRGFRAEMELAGEVQERLYWPRGLREKLKTKRGQNG